MEDKKPNLDGLGPAGVEAPAAKRRQLWAFRGAAILLGLLPLIALELGLRLLGVGDPAAQRDPLAGFSRHRPLFEQDGDRYRTARSREPFFGEQEFLAKKPTNGFRVFCLGGSTVYGHPYLNATAFPAWLELELAARDPVRRFEIVNCGGVSYASYRLAPIVHEVLHYQPDLIILAMGHNEFLEDRTFQPLKARSPARRWLADEFFSLHLVTSAQKLLGRDQPASGDLALSPEVKPRLDDAATGYASYHRDEAWHHSVMRQFEESLRRMIADCRAANVPVMIVALGSNLRDCPPFKSEHRTGLTPEAEAQWQSVFDVAGQAEETDLPAALALYQQAQTIDSEYALLTYRVARCFDRLGQTERARENFLRAKDQDVCPLRMLESMNEVQRRIAAETRTPLVDARKLLESLSPDGLPGSDLYLDQVHPTIGGHQKVARIIANRMVELRRTSAATWSDEARVAAYARKLRALEPAYFSNGRRRVAWLENWARRQSFFAETLPVDANGCLRQGFRALELEDETGAWRLFRRALAQDAALAKRLAEHGAELRKEGRGDSASRLVKQLGELVVELRKKTKSLYDSHSAGD